MSWSEIAGRASLALIVLLFLVYRVMPVVSSHYWQLGSMKYEDLNEQYQQSRQITEQDRDWMTRTVFVETLGEPLQGHIAVAWVIKNRWLESPYTNWSSISKVVSACGYITRNKQSVKVCQFEPWLSKAKKKRLFGLKTDSRNYAHYRDIVDDVLEGMIADPIAGRRCFMNAAIVKRRKGKLPVCKAGNCLTIGQHTFYYCPGWARMREAKI